MTLVPKYIKKLSPYIPGKRIEDIELNSNSKKIIKLSSNENPLGPSTKAIKILDNCFNDLHRYPDSSGLLLRNKFFIFLELLVIILIINDKMVFNN